MRKCVILLAAAVAVLTGNAEAQTWAEKEFRNFCVMGSLNACGSVIVRTHWTGTVTEVQMLVRNEQGSIFNNITTAGSYLTAIGLTAPTIEGLAGEPMAPVDSRTGGL